MERVLRVIGIILASSFLCKVITLLPRQVQGVKTTHETASIEQDYQYTTNEKLIVPNIQLRTSAFLMRCSHQTQAISGKQLPWTHPGEWRAQLVGETLQNHTKIHEAWWYYTLGLSKTDWFRVVAFGGGGYTNISFLTPAYLEIQLPK